MLPTKPNLFDPSLKSNGLIPSIDIENLVRMRASAIERIERAIALIGEANEIARNAHLGKLDIRLYLSKKIFCEFEEDTIPEYVQRQLDTAAWAYLMDKSGTRTFLDATARSAWDNRIANKDVPALTIANITAAFQLINALRPDMFERGVIQCFKSLSWNYKTNEPFKFGERIILKNFLISYGNKTIKSIHLNRNRTDELDDLIRVFSTFDGEPESDHRNGIWHQLCASIDARDTKWDGKYFSLRWYNKGTAHMTFKRMDLVNRLNEILAKYYPLTLATDRR